MTPDLTGLTWTRPSACSGTSSVEITTDGTDVLLRDTKRPDRLPLAFTRDEFRAFTDSVINGDFDDL